MTVDISNSFSKSFDERLQILLYSNFDSWTAFLMVLAKALGSDGGQVKPHPVSITLRSTSPPVAAITGLPIDK